jgi:CHAD domain-containing protein
MCRLLKQLQDRLGRMQDRQVLQHTLREAADRLDARLGKHQHKAVKHLLKQIKTDKRRLMDESAIMASIYTRDSAPYIRQLLE